MRNDLIEQALKEWYVKKNWAQCYNFESIKAIYNDAIDEFFVDPRDESGDFESAINEYVEREMRLYQPAPDVKLP